MKKVIFLIALVIISTGIHAQDTLKPFNNRWGTELNINPFNGTFALNNATGQIKLRKFLPNNQAIRLAFTVSYMQDNSKEDNVYGLNPEDSQILQRSLMVSLNAGKEKHFGGSKHLSPYLGFDVGFGIKKSSESYRSNDTYRKIKGAWEEVVMISPQYYSTRYTERAFWSIGANIVSGIDIYVTRDFYVGYEIAFGLDYTNYNNIEVSQDPPQNNPAPDINDESWKFGPKLLNGIRIGYVF